MQHGFHIYVYALTLLPTTLPRNPPANSHIFPTFHKLLGSAARLLTSASFLHLHTKHLLKGTKHLPSNRWYSLEYWLLLCYEDVPAGWSSKLRRTTRAKTLACRGAVAAAATVRKTLAAPAFWRRLTWCIACRPPGIVNCNLRYQESRFVTEACKETLRETYVKYSNNVSLKQDRNEHFQQTTRSTCMRANAAHDLRTAALLRSIATNLPTSAPLHIVQNFVSFQQNNIHPCLASKPAITCVKNLCMSSWEELLTALQYRFHWSSLSNSQWPPPSYRRVHCHHHVIKQTTNSFSLLLESVLPSTA